MTATGKTITVVMILIAVGLTPSPLFDVPLADQTNIIEETQTEWVYLGEFRTTGYCKCVECCGKWSEFPSPDKQPGDCVGVDFDEIPRGTKLYIAGIGERTALDTGAAANGKTIDVLYDTHEQAQGHALQWLNVWMIKEIP